MSAPQADDFAPLRALLDPCTILGNDDRALLARLLREHAERGAALEPFAHFARQWARQPMRGMADEFYTIHTGTEYEAALRLSDLAAAARSTPAPGDGQ